MRDCYLHLFSFNFSETSTLDLNLVIFAVQDDRSLKLLELRKLLNRLPKTNLAVLEFIFHHFVR